QALDDPQAGLPAREAGRHDRDAERLQRPRDVDPLAARERQPRARAVALPALEVRDSDRAVDGRIQRDGDDHEKRPPMLWSVRLPYQPNRPARFGRATEREATSDRLPRSRVPLQISTRPSRCPARIGREAASGATTRSRSEPPTRTVETSGAVATSASVGRP